MNIDEHIEVLLGKVITTQVEIEKIEGQRSKLQLKKLRLEHELNNLNERIEIAKGEKFAQECIEGQHLTCLWNEIPQVMKNDMMAMYRDIFDEKYKFKSAITQDMSDNAMQEAITKFKEKYKLTKILLS